MYEQREDDVDREIVQLQREIYGDVKEEGWFKEYWRPAIAWLYFVINLFDFLVAPILTGIFSYATGAKLVMWVPLTLQGGGLFHLSMLAILGIYAWQRSEEKKFNNYGRYGGYGGYGGNYGGYNNNYGGSDLEAKKARLKELIKKKKGVG